jgi:hypothetical protein
MTIYPVTITTDAHSLADARKRIRAYRDLFCLQRETLIYVRGVFKEARTGELVFLTGHACMVDITANTIKWFDPDTKKRISMLPTEPFELIIGS